MKARNRYISKEALINSLMISQSEIGEPRDFHLSLKINHFSLSILLVDPSITGIKKPTSAGFFRSGPDYLILDSL